MYRKNGRIPDVYGSSILDLCPANGKRRLN
jgi:hypothetical protein